MTNNVFSGRQPSVHFDLSKDDAKMEEAKDLNVISLTNSATSTINKLLGRKQASDSTISCVRSWDKATEIFVTIAGFRIKDRFTHIYTMIKHPYKQVIDIHIAAEVNTEQHKFITQNILSRKNPPAWANLVNVDHNTTLLNFQLRFEDGYEHISFDACQYIISSHRNALCTVSDTRLLYDVYQVTPDRIIYASPSQLESYTFYQDMSLDISVTELNNLKQQVSSVESRILKLIHKYGSRLLITIPEFNALGTYFK
jgi:hypothetical protein